MTEPAAIPAPRPGRRWRRRFLFLLLIALVAGGTLLWTLWRSKPTYWQILDPASPAVQSEAAEIERQLPTLLTRVRPDEPTWTLEVSQTQINAWLSARLPQWLSNQGVNSQVTGSVRNPMVAIFPDRIEIAAEVNPLGREQVVRALFRPDYGNPQAAAIRFHRLMGGRLPLPSSWLADQVLARLDHRHEEARSLVERIVVKGEPWLLVQPVDRHRQVRVVDLRLETGRLVLTCRTELKPPR
ncbi:MAG: hypothetical protein OER86_05465 [Phycisphaerae bacterium]|nr:hypothetical protein [Phycisphaerae bacterium]